MLIDHAIEFARSEAISSRCTTYVYSWPGVLPAGFFDVLRVEPHNGKKTVATVHPDGTIERDMRCWCGARMLPAGRGKFPYDCISKDKYPNAMVFHDCENGHGAWTHEYAW